MISSILASPYATYILIAYGVAIASLLVYAIVMSLGFIKTRRQFRAAGLDRGA